jgi:phosphatidylserine/phosphatidylglycerophosphate/cardiolipin synthase-like enzyme
MKRLSEVALGLATDVLFASPAIQLWTEPKAAATPPSITIQTCFAPEDDCAAVVVRAIDGAEKIVMAGAYALTEPRIIAALVRAKERGLDVGLIADKGVPCERRGGIPVLVAAGVEVSIDDKVRLAHWKMVAIDGHTTVAGSFNFSVAASHNSEDLMVIESPEITAAFVDHWSKRRLASTPYQNNPDWCQGRK